MNSRAVLVMKLWIDCETYSDLDLRTVGTYKYAKSCEVMLVSYAIDDAPVQCWDRTIDQTPPPDLVPAIAEASEFWAHNSMFDRNCLTDILHPPIEKWRDTMVQAFCHSLPGALGKLCELYNLGSDQAKSKDGRRLILLFCKPRPSKSKLRRATRETHPEDWQKFIDYAMSDVEAMRALHSKMPRWNYPNNIDVLGQWHLDQRINDRGFAVGIEMAEAVIRAVDREQVRLSAATKAQTEGAVSSTRQAQALRDYIFDSYGVYLEDVTKSTVTRVLEDPDLPAEVRDLLDLRQQSAKSSTSKYKALIDIAVDGRAQGTIQFSGAARTGRAAGRKFQPQNLPSRGLLPNKLVDDGIKMMMMDCADLVFPDVMHLASSAIRKAVVAPLNQKLVISDLSNIEGRVLAWAAGEAWKIQAFREFDSGDGHDLYNLAYAKAFNVPVESVTKAQRDIGKVMELMLGYGGGVGAFVTGALGYGFDLEKLADDIWDTLPQDVLNESASFLDWMYKQKRPRFGLTDKAFVTVETLKRLWRDAHPATTAFWRDVQDAMESVITSKTVQTVGLLTFDMRGAWLRIKLPSGRYLCYPQASVKADGVSYYGVDQFTKAWQEIRTYSGKCTENICQAVARDVLYYAMPRVEAAGYQIILHVHDELGTEVVDIPEFNHDTLSGLLAAGEPWTEGLPLAAAGFEDYRYRKG